MLGQEETKIITCKVIGDPQSVERFVEKIHRTNKVLIDSGDRHNQHDSNVHRFLTLFVEEEVS